MDNQFITLARQLFQEALSKQGKSLIQFDPNSPFSETNINILQEQVQAWKDRCDNMFNGKGHRATMEYWGGEWSSLRNTEEMKGPSFFNKVADSSQVDILFKEGYALAIKIRKLLTGQNNKIRFLFNIDGQYVEQEYDEEQLFSEDTNSIVKIVNSSNAGAINARYKMEIKKEMKKKLVPNNFSNNIDSVLFNYIIQHSNIKINNQGEIENALGYGRVYEAYYEILEKGYDIEKRTGRTAITNLIRHRFKKDVVWGVQQVGDIQEIGPNNTFNQVQLKSFADSDSANFGGLPSLITQMNRIDSILEKIKTKQKNISQDILQTFYYDADMTKNTANTLFNQSRQYALDYIEENLKYIMN